MMDGATRRARVLVHVGLPKTGTTSLQQLLFERSANIRYFGQTNLWSDPEAKSVLRAMLLDGENVAAARAIVADALRTHQAVVISDEALTFGEFMLRATRWPVVSAPSATAARIRDLLGEDTDILIVLRDQADWLQSWHRQGLKTGKYAETEFQRWLDKDLGPIATAKLFDLLRYDRLYQAFRDVFGADRVHLRWFEDYADRYDDLAAEVAELIGLDGTEARALVADQAQNVTGTHFTGLPPVVQRLARNGPGPALLGLLPRSLRQRLRGLIARRKAYGGLTETERAEVCALFTESNRRLVRLAGDAGCVADQEPASR